MKRGFEHGMHVFGVAGYQLCNHINLKMEGRVPKGRSSGHKERRGRSNRF